MSIDLVIVLLFAAAIALWAKARGGEPERYCAAIIAIGILVDRVYSVWLGDRGFVDFSVSRLSLDILQLAAFLLVALFANRVWPLWLAAAQIVCITGSVAVMINDEGMIQAFWAMTQLPIFIELTALSLGILAHSHREQRVGAYNHWSLGMVGGKR